MPPPATPEPVIYIATAADALKRTAGLVGPGRVWTMLLRPDIKAGEGGQGRIWPLTPEPTEIDAARAAAQAARVAARVNIEDQVSAVERERDVVALGDRTSGKLGELNKVHKQGRGGAGVSRLRNLYLLGRARYVDGREDEVFAPRCQHPELVPGRLLAHAWAGRGLLEVRSGDTVIAPTADASGSESLASWAAGLLLMNGWRVVLGGTVLDVAAPTPALLWLPTDLDLRRTIYRR